MHLCPTVTVMRRDIDAHGYAAFWFPLPFSASFSSSCVAVLRESAPGCACFSSASAAIIPVGVAIGAFSVYC